MTGGTRRCKGRKGHRREVCFGQSSTGSDVGGLILPLSYCLSLNSKGQRATDTLMIDFEHGEIVNNFLDTLYLGRVVRDCFLWYLNDLLIYIQGTPCFMARAVRSGVPVPPSYPEAVVFRLMPEIEMEETSRMSTEVIVFLGFLNYVIFSCVLDDPKFRLHTARAKVAEPHNCFPGAT